MGAVQIEVRTSAIRGDRASSALIGNGKNAVESMGETVIIERLFTSSEADAKKFQEEKSEKYLKVAALKLDTKFCAYGEKHYKSLEDFLDDKYVNPTKTFAPSPSPASADSKILHKPTGRCTVS